jgi:hypothetical protein
MVKIIAPFSVLLALVFIGFGDQFLPDPVADWSKSSRSVIISTLTKGLDQGLNLLPRDDRSKTTEKKVKDVSCMFGGSCDP